MHREGGSNGPGEGTEASTPAEPSGDRADESAFPCGLIPPPRPQGDDGSLRGGGAGSGFPAPDNEPKTPLHHRKITLRARSPGGSRRGTEGEGPEMMDFVMLFVAAGWALSFRTIRLRLQ